MATLLHRVHDNFIWRIEGLTPTSTRSRRKFRSLDRQTPRPGEHFGVTRGFRVQRLGSGADVELTDFTCRVADHRYAVEVYYGDEFGGTAVHEVADQDRHDIIKDLRYPGSWNGFNSSNTDTDIGIMDRQLLGDSFDFEGGAWILRLEFGVKAKEAEYA